MLQSYPFFYVDISSVLYEQPGNICVTISYSFSKWNVPENLGKKKTQEGTVIHKAHFLFCND